MVTTERRLPLQVRQVADAAKQHAICFDQLHVKLGWPARLPVDAGPQAAEVGVHGYSLAVTEKTDRPGLDALRFSLLGCVVQLVLVLQAQLSLKHAWDCS